MFRFGPYALDTKRLCLTEAGARLALRPKSFDVLLALVRARGQVLPKNDLIKAVWKDVAVGDDSLTQCIHDIRRALNDKDGRYIRTVPRRGYEFVADVVETEEPREPAAGRPRSRSGLKAVGTAIAIAMLTIVLSAAWMDSPAHERRRLSIAVLPFDDLGSGEGGGWLGYGFAEDTLTALAQFRDLSVMGYRSSSRVGEERDARIVGDRLGADYLLTGSVRHDDGQLRISARLLDAQTGVALWAETYDRPYADIFTLQDRIAGEVAARLAVHAREATAERLRNQRPERLEAYELAIRGRKAYRSFSRDGVTEARVLAERATQLDPGFAPAWEVLAASLLQFYLQPFDGQQGLPATLAAARTAAENAVAADPEYATGQAMLAAVLLHSREYDAALDAARKAVELNPQDSVAQGVYANISTFTGDYREATAAWERAARIDPFVPAINNALWSIPHVMLGEYDEALALAQSCAGRPQSPHPCLLYLALSATALGHEDEARQAVERLRATNPGFSIAQYRRSTLFRSEEELASVVNLMRRAGFPEL